MIVACLQKFNFNPVYSCFPHLQRYLLFFSGGKSTVLRDRCDRDFRGVNKSRVERISKRRSDRSDLMRNMIMICNEEKK